MTEYLDQYMKSSSPAAPAKSDSKSKAKTKGGMEEFTKILEKKVEKVGDTMKTRASAYMEKADRADAIHIMKGMYTLYACPDDKSDFETRYKSWKLSDDAKASNGHKKLKSNVKRLDMTFEKLGVKGNMTYLGWAKALNPYVSANEGLYDNTLTCCIPLHSSLLYCKGFWASLKIKSAIKLYDTWTTRGEPLASKIAKDAEATFGALKKLKADWDIDYLEQAAEQGLKPKDKAWLAKYNPAIFHILDPMMLWRSFEWADPDVKDREKYMSEIRKRIAMFINNWAPKDQSFKDMNEAAKKRYYEKVCKPIQKLAGFIRRPEWYDPRVSAKSGSNKSVRENFTFNEEVGGLMAQPLFDPAPKSPEDESKEGRKKRREEKEKAKAEAAEAEEKKKKAESKKESKEEESDSDSSDSEIEDTLPTGEATPSS